MAEPELVVFDLDFTLWDCGGLWVDCAAYPFRKCVSGEIVDSTGRTLRLYEGVFGILDWLDERNIIMALASRTEQPRWACKLLDLFGIRDRFQFAEIYPGSKTAHFEKLQNDSNIAWDRMLFFDDEARNLKEVGALGVRCVEVRNGLSRELVLSAME